MRYSTLVRVAVVSLGVGLVGWVPAAAASQSQPGAVASKKTAPRPLSRNVRIDVTRTGEWRGPRTLRFTLSPSRSLRIKQEGTGDPPFTPPPQPRLMPLRSQDR
jgi:hypothetical protein